MVKHEIKLSKEEYEEYVLLKEKLDLELESRMKEYDQENAKGMYCIMIMSLLFGIIISIIVVAILDLLSDDMQTGIIFVSYILVCVISTTAGYMIKRSSQNARY